MDKLKRLFQWLIKGKKIDVEFVPSDTDMNIYNRYLNARQLLDNPLFSTIYEEIKQEIFKAWQTSPARDYEARDILYLRLEALDKMVGKFKACIANYEFDYENKRQEETATDTQ